MVTLSDPKNEEQLAIERNQKNQNELIGKRTCYLAVASISIILAGIFLIYGFAMMALITLVIGMIYLSQYFDANGHLHEVRSRSTKKLVTNLSVLRTKKGTTSKTQSPSH